MPQLHFHEDGRPLFVHVLREGRTVIGRSDSCDLALPSESVSRVHCVIDGRAGAWSVQDRSRHGTQVNGKRADATTALEDNDEIAIGTYRARFVVAEDDSMLLSLRSPTETLPASEALYEELLEGNQEVFAARRAVVKFVRGRRAGDSIVLSQARTSVGGPGATIELDDKLPQAATYIRVVRGRPMVEPGRAPAFLEDILVRHTTPVLPGEEVRVGDHEFVIDIETIEDKARELESFGQMVGRTAVMRRLFAVLQRMAGHDAPVLLSGESGTGKELAARGLHDGGPRFDRPFVAVNCAAIAESLVESELFGHEKGAFTGASNRSDGAFQRAAGGTLFLDEMGEMQPDLQAKLLRALESGEVRRVGGSVAEYPDVRVISATNRNLQEMVRRGLFRQDLYFRLAVLTVRLPSLRERLDDVPVLAQKLLERHHPGARLTPEALEALKEYEWPGNVRELRNVLTRAVVMTGPLIGPGDLTFNPWSFEDPSGAHPGGASADAGAAGVMARPTLGAHRSAPPRGPLGPPSPLYEDPEREQLELALEQAGGNRAQAARILGIPRTSLLYKMQKFGLVR